MIIKKKYTNIKKHIDAVGQEHTTETAVENLQPVELSEKNTDEKKKNIENKELIDKEEKDKKEKTEKKLKNLDLSVEDITFEQREERREGTRRRGYRRTQDRNLVSRAQKEAVSIKEQAKQDGYKEGLNLAQNDIEDLKTKFEEFYGYKNEVFDKVSGCILDISVEIAKKIINKEIQVDKEAVLPIIKNVVEEVNKTENKIVLKVMPKDVELVRDKIPEIFSGNYYEAKISVIPDNSIKEGGVIVETSNGIIDASIETQIAIIEKALRVQEES